MSILTCSHPKDGGIFTCAQRGCQGCMEYLLEKHIGLVHACVRYLEVGGVPYMEAVEEGRIGLWRAIQGYDSERGVAFSTYAWWFIRGRVLNYVMVFGQQREGLEEEPYQIRYAELAEAAWQAEQIGQALREGLELLPKRLRRVVEDVYGLGENPPMKMAEIGREMGVTRERVRQLRNEGLALLRLPGLSLGLRELCERDSRQDYRQARQMSNVWLRSRRGKR